jgi:hypothetical protein
MLLHCKTFIAVYDSVHQVVVYSIPNKKRAANFQKQIGVCCYFNSCLNEKYAAFFSK